MRKVNAFKNNAWKVKRVQKTFENLNSFLDDVENAKNDANILKTYFWIFIVFHYFLDFLKTLSKRWGQKLGNNKGNLINKKN
jgi:3-methyladenine DNA glycosylase Tag